MITPRIKEVIRSTLNAFRESVLQSIENITLAELQLKKNPYLLSSMCFNDEDLIDRWLEAFVSSSAETKFGSILENIAKSACVDGMKSSTSGVDIDVIRGNIRLFISVKSGPFWGNSQSTKEQGAAFKKAKRVVSQNDTTQQMKSVMGICYSKSRTSTNLSYADLKFTGQNFWYILSLQKDFFTELAIELRWGVEDFAKQLKIQMDRTHVRLLSELRSECGGVVWECMVEKCCGNFSEDDEWVKNLIKTS